MPRYTLNVAEDFYARITAAAEADRRSIGAEMLWLIERGLDAREQENA